MLMVCITPETCSLSDSANAHTKVSSTTAPVAALPFIKLRDQSAVRERPLLFPVLVRGLERFSEEDVKELFVDCGDVRSVHRSGSDKWLVYFADKSSAALGQRLNGTDFEVFEIALH